MGRWRAGKGASVSAARLRCQPTADPRACRRLPIASTARRTAMHRCLSTLLLCTALAGCAIAPPQTATPAGTGAVAANDNLNAVA